MPSAAPDKFKSRSDLLKLYKRFFRMINSQIKRRHRAGASGLDVARWRADLLDMVLRDLFTRNEREPEAAEKPVEEIADQAPPEGEGAAGAAGAVGTR